jgi:hypothetical protein
MGQERPKGVLMKALPLLAVLIAPILGIGAEPRDKRAKAEGEYASLNGLKMYYEVHGIGKPLG